MLKNGNNQAEQTMASKQELERQILDSAKRGPVFASRFAQVSGVEEHEVKLALRRLKGRGRIYQAMRPTRNFYGSTEAGWKATCGNDGCYRPHGHNGNCARS